MCIVDKKIMVEILVNLENINDNQKCLKDKIKEIYSKLSTITDQSTPQQRKPDDRNTKSIMEYLEKNYSYLQNMGETQTKEKAYKTKN